DERIAEVFLAHRERARTLVDIADAVATYLPGHRHINAEAGRKFLTADALPFLTRFLDLLRAAPFDKPAQEQIFTTMMAETGEKMARLAQPLRVALTGKSVSPGIYDVLRLLGKDEAITRVAAVIRALEDGKPEWLAS
ncbi:MAG TPA: hypothetical protein VIH11_04380, partial [Gemmatimonadaceae bacterium]